MTTAGAEGPSYSARYGRPEERGKAIGFLRDFPRSVWEPELDEIAWMEASIRSGRRYTLVFCGDELVGVGLTDEVAIAFEVSPPRRPPYVHYYYGRRFEELWDLLGAVLRERDEGNKDCPFFPHGSILANVFYGEGAPTGAGKDTGNGYFARPGREAERSWACGFLRRLAEPESAPDEFHREIEFMATEILSVQAAFTLVFRDEELVGAGVTAADGIHHYCGHWSEEVEALLKVAHRRADRRYFANRISAIHCHEQGWGEGCSARIGGEDERSRALNFLAKNSSERPELSDLYWLMVTAVCDWDSPYALVFDGARLVGAGVSLPDFERGEGFTHHYYIGRWSDEVGTMLEAALRQAGIEFRGGIVANEPYGLT